MKVISIHKKRNGSQSLGYKYSPPKKGMVRAMVSIKGETRHIDIPAEKK